VVYARTVNTSSLTFQVSGRLWRNSLVMRDRETGTWWSHVTGTAISGPLAKTQLTMVPSVQTTWGEWKQQHPTTSVLAKDREVLASHYQKYFDDPDRIGLFRARWLVDRMPGKELVYGAAVGPHAVAVRDRALNRPVQLVLGTTPVVVVKGKDGGVRCFNRRAGERIVELEKNEASGTFMDRRGGSEWDLTTGIARSGSLVGTRLEEIPVTSVYWFAWSSFYPNTQVVDESR